MVCGQNKVFLNEGRTNILFEKDGPDPADVALLLPLHVDGMDVPLQAGLHTEHPSIIQKVRSAIGACAIRLAKQERIG